MKMYNAGEGDQSSANFSVPTVKKMGADGKVREFVKVPLSFGRDQFVEHRPGNVYLPIDGVGFFTVPRGGFVDVPGGISAKAIKGLAPHLLSEEEYILAQQQAEAAPAVEPIAEPGPATADLVPVVSDADDKPKRGRPPIAR